jgi:hypothetical protein
MLLIVQLLMLMIKKILISVSHSSEVIIGITFLSILPTKRLIHLFLATPHTIEKTGHSMLF